MSHASGYVELGSDEATFVIRSTSGALAGDEWSGNTLVTLEAEILEEGDVWVHTGHQWGPFAISTQLLTAPSTVSSEWEDVVEFSLACSGELVVAELVNHDPTTELLSESGDYRIRVSARGRTLDEVTEDQETSETPVEHYLVEAWPAPLAPPEAIRLTSRYAVAELTGPEPEPEIEGSEAGLAGARAIGRDVDGASGARDLSGRTGVLTASRVLRGTRRKLFRPFAFVTSWSPGVPTWSYLSGAMEYQLGLPGYGFASDHQDQLSGSRGSIRSVFVEVDRPRRVVRGWNWMIRVVPIESLSLIPFEPFFNEDTLLTITFTETKDAAGQAWTDVQIEHAGLPVEWIDDMRAWWRFQLAIAEHRAFGTRA